MSRTQYTLKIIALFEKILDLRTRSHPHAHQSFMEMKAEKCFDTLKCSIALDMQASHYPENKDNKDFMLRVADRFFRLQLSQDDAIETFFGELLEQATGDQNESFRNLMCQVLAAL